MLLISRVSENPMLGCFFNQPFEGGGWKTNSTAEEILLRGYDVQVPEMEDFLDVLRK